MMLKPLRHCACCGTKLKTLRSTKTYCSDACRKKAARGGSDLHAIKDGWRLFNNLRSNGFVGRIWSVYSWDDSPPIYALLVPLEIAIQEQNGAFRETGIPEEHLPTEGDYKRALDAFDVTTGNAGERLKTAIKAFYEARKDRKIRQSDPKGKGFASAGRG